HRGALHVAPLPAPALPLRCLRHVDVVGDHVPQPPLRRRPHGGQPDRRRRVLPRQGQVPAAHAVGEAVPVGLRLRRVRRGRRGRGLHVQPRGPGRVHAGLPRRQRRVDHRVRVQHVGWQPGAVGRAAVARGGVLGGRHAGQRERSRGPPYQDM
ncbi:hypothetical protein LTR53_011108, partial [Teratosphaeriaceae sp. CCFEE 6253]